MRITVVSKQELESNPRTNRTLSHFSPTMPQQQEQQPSEVQIILDDALTDLEALVDHYLPPSKDGGLAGRMMAAIELAGASATKSIGGVVPAVVVPSPSASPRRSSRGRQPARSRSNTSRSQYSESSVEVSYYDEPTDESAYDTNEDTKSYCSSVSGGDELLKPVASVVVRKDKSKSTNAGASGTKSKDELMNQTIETAANTTVDALDTSYFSQEEEEEEEEPATIPTAAPSGKVETADLAMEDDTAAIDGPLPESPRRKAEREADEAAERLAHRSYFSKMSSFDQLLDERSNSNNDKADEAQANTKTKITANATPSPLVAARKEPTNTGSKTVAEKTHELVQKYRLEKKQQMADADKGTKAVDDEFATDAGVERRREERRAEERRRLTAVAEHRRRLAYNAKMRREMNAAAAETVRVEDKSTNPSGPNASDGSESTADSLADDIQSMVVTDLD